MPRTTERAQRNVANVVGIIVGVILVGLSMWGGSAAGVSETGESRAAIPWFVHFGAGALAVGGVLLAQRWRRRRLGQIALVIAAVILVGAVLRFRYFGPWAWATFILPAVVLLLSAPFLAPMPAPDMSSTVPDRPGRADNLP
jgi:hypothetical protein